MKKWIIGTIVAITLVGLATILYTSKKESAFQVTLWLDGCSADNAKITPFTVRIDKPGTVLVALPPSGMVAESKTGETKDGRALISQPKFHDPREIFALVLPGSNQEYRLGMEGETAFLVEKPGLLKFTGNHHGTFLGSERYFSIKTEPDEKGNLVTAPNIFRFVIFEPGKYTGKLAKLEKAETYPQAMLPEVVKPKNEHQDLNIVDMWKLERALKPGKQEKPKKPGTVSM